MQNGDGRRRREQDEQQDRPTNPLPSQSSGPHSSPSLRSRSLPEQDNTADAAAAARRRPHPSIYRTYLRPIVSSPLPSVPLLTRRLRPGGAQISAAPPLDPPTHPHWRETHPAWAHEVRTHARSRLFRPLAPPRRLGSPIRVLLSVESSRRALRPTHAHVRVANPVLLMNSRKKM